MKMTANYHTHTFRCGHATGTEREYIEQAITAGIQILGFSDHAPFSFPDGYESGFRVPTDKAQDYIETLQALRAEYKNKIEIHIGFECEYYPLFFEGMRNYLADLGAEYLILGQHFIRNEHPNGIYSGGKHITNEMLPEYADCVIAGMQTGVFSYLAHPDVFKFSDGDTQAYVQENRRICRAAAAFHIPLEINFLGIRDNRHYPNNLFWQIAGEEGCTAVFGMDAHSVVDAGDLQSVERAEEIVQQYGLKVSERVNLKPLR